MSWRQHAACRGLDAELFFPQRGESTTEAQTVCAGCLVGAECLAHAVARPERFGIWGGTSERQRRRLRATARARSTSLRPQPVPVTEPLELAS